MKLVPIIGAFGLSAFAYAQTPHALWAVRGNSKAMFSQDGRYVATFGGSRAVAIRDANTGRQICAIQEPTGNITALAFSKDGKYFAVGFGIGGYNLELRRLGDGSLAAAIIAHDAVRVLAFSPRDHVLLSGGSEGQLKLWQQIGGALSQIGQLPNGYPGHPSGMNAVAFAPSGTSFALGDGSTVKLFGMEPFHKVFTGLDEAVGIQGVAISPDETKIVSCSDERDSLQNYSIKFWSTASGERVGYIPAGGPMCSIVYNPDGRFVISAGALGSGGTLQFWRVSDNANVQTCVWNRPIVNMTMSGDGRKIAFATEDRVIRVVTNPYAPSPG